jgi:hypothetical protein
MGVLWTWIAAVYLSAIALPLVLKTHYRHFIAVLLVWFVLNTAFFTVWQPEYFVFRVPAVIASCMLLAMVASHYRARRSGAIWLVSIAIWVAFCGVSNYVLSISHASNASGNRFYASAMTFKANTKPNDLIILTGSGDAESSEVYIPYFAKRQVFSIHTEMAHSHNDFNVLKATLQNKIASTRLSGGSVYITNDFFDSPTTMELLQRQHKITTPMILSIFDDNSKVLAWGRKPWNPVWLLEPKTADTQHKTKRRRHKHALPIQAAQSDGHTLIATNDGLRTGK